MSDDITNTFVINTEGLIGVLDQLVDGEGGVVWLNDGVGDLGGGHDGESAHHSVGVLLTDLGDEECSHTRTSTTTERVGDLETLEAVAASASSDDIEDLVDELSTLGVVTLGPVVMFLLTSTRLTEDEVIWSEELTERTSSDGVHCAWFQIHEDGSGNVSLCLVPEIWSDSLNLFLGRDILR